MSRNERLLDALNRAALTPDTLAERIAVDPKTVERWITQSRVPYPRHRHRLAAALGESERWLWPDAVDDERREHAARSEVITVYAHRHQIPGETWLRLFADVSERIDVLVYAGLFLPEQTLGSASCSGPKPPPASRSGCCLATHTASTSGSVARRKASETLSPPRSATFCTSTATSPRPKSRCGYTPPRCTRRSTAATTR
jgi:transcriptional regulator with XRE-family HTH domain